MRAPAWLVVSCSIAVLIGIAFRFSLLDSKALFGDEAVSSLNAAGYAVQQYKTAVDPHKAQTASALFERFQNGAAQGSSRETVHALATFDPAHPPVYFVALRLWETAAGDSVAARRGLAALFGSLLVLALFWLGWELCGSWTAAWLTAAIAALSPFDLVYSQQIREYSLFALMCALTAAILLRAFRKGSGAAWVLYAAAMLVSLYAALLSAFVLAAFIVYAVLRERRWSAAMRSFAISTGAAFVLYVPWLLAVKRGWQSVVVQNNYFALPLAPKLYLAKLIFAVGSVFFDAEYADVRLFVFLVLAFAAAAYALRGFYRYAPADAKLFISSLIVVNALIIIGGDIVTHSGHIKGARYLYPAFIGLQTAVAIGFATLMARPATGLKKFAPAAGAGGLLLIELFSCAVALRHTSWWANNDGAPIQQAARYVERDRSPLVVTDRWTALVMSNSLHTDVTFAFDPRSALTYARGKTVYYYAPANRTADVASFGRVTGAVPQSLDLSMRRSTADTTSGSGYELWRFSRRPLPRR